jgi:hypothetical protein
LTKDINVVSTVAVGSGVALPTAVAGMEVKIANLSANTLLVYPASADAIDSLGTNAAFSLPGGARIEFFAINATNWFTLNSTYA